MPDDTSVGGVDEPLIRIRGLYKVFGSDPASVMPLVREGRSKDDILAETGHAVGLKDINLDIERGRIFVIMGLSGSGKSTLIRHFNRLIDPTEGSIVIDGTDVMSLSIKELEAFRRDKMSMVFQRFGLMPHRTVGENAAYGLAVQGMGKRERREKAQEWLRAVGLDGYENQYPSQLSGGQQQRVGLARALATDAEVLLMDEAFSALDPLIRSGMQDQLIELQEKLHKTIVFITHDLDEALRLGNKIAILKDGELVQVGAPEDILLHPADDYVEAFVKDVNRARALTVETVMKPPVCRISSATIGEALRQMRGETHEYAHFSTAEGFRGVISVKSLETAAASNPDAPIGEHLLENVNAVSIKTLIEHVLPATLEMRCPVPVLDADGNLCGQVSRAALAAVLGEAPEANGKAGKTGGADRAPTSTAS